MLGKGFFFAESYNPDLPEEIWTLVDEIGAGSYSKTLPWGKYKIVLSGGGGAGGCCIREPGAGDLDYIYAGSAGEQKTVYIDIIGGETKVISGIVGSGASGSSVSITSTHEVASSFGSVGTGYANGQTGTKYAISRTEHPFGGASWGSAGGSGGGSTSLFVDAVLNSIGKGGNGGSVTINESGWRIAQGGTGGSGGISSGSGAPGGNYEYWRAADGHGSQTITSGSGSDGYVKIYKSNLRP